MANPLVIVFLSNDINYQAKLSPGKIWQNCKGV